MSKNNHKDCECFYRSFTKKKICSCSVCADRSGLDFRFRLREISEISAPALREHERKKLFMNNNRRHFIKNAAALAALVGLPSDKNFAKADTQELLDAAAATAPSKGKPVFGLKVPPIQQVGVGIIGLGNRGAEHARLIDAVGLEKCKLTAICDVRPEMVGKVMDALHETGRQKPHRIS